MSSDPFEGLSAYAQKNDRIKELEKEVDRLKEELANAMHPEFGDFWAMVRERDRIVDEVRTAYSAYRHNLHATAAVELKAILDRYPET